MHFSSNTTTMSGLPVGHSLTLTPLVERSNHVIRPVSL